MSNRMDVQYMGLWKVILCITTVFRVMACSNVSSKQIIKTVKYIQILTSDSFLLKPTDWLQVKLVQSRFFSYASTFLRIQSMIMMSHNAQKLFRKHFVTGVTYLRPVIFENYVPTKVFLPDVHKFLGFFVHLDLDSWSILLIAQAVTDWKLTIQINDMKLTYSNKRPYNLVCSGQIGIFILYLSQDRL